MAAATGNSGKTAAQLSLSGSLVLLDLLARTPSAAAVFVMGETLESINEVTSLPACNGTALVVYISHN